MNAKVDELAGVFEDVCREPYGAARRAAEGGRKVAGYMCTYTPEELLHAAGYLPVRVLGWTDGTQRADALMQSYACSLARAALHMGLSGELDFLDLMFFPHTCDTIQNLTDIWKRNVPSMLHLSIDSPVQTAGEAAVRHLQGELARAREQLAAHGTPVSDEALRASMALYDEHREAMRRLYALRRGNPALLPAKQLLAVILASFQMPKEEHLAQLKALLTALEGDEGTPQPDVPRVFVAGAACQLAEYMAAVEECGCVVADDEMCTGSRAFAVQGVTGVADPLEALARMYLARTPCPAKHCPGFDPGADIAGKARAAKADGVVFLFTKFCDPWAFDYPRMREQLDAEGVPSLLLEIEQHQPPAEQFKTRVAAFAEVLNANRGK